MREMIREQNQWLVVSFVRLLTIESIARPTSLISIEQAATVDDVARSERRSLPRVCRSRGGTIISDIIYFLSWVEERALQYSLHRLSDLGYAGTFALSKS